MSNSIKKNDAVTLNQPYTTTNGTVIPAGTELKVWKAQRNGMLNCTIADRSHPCYYYSLHLHSPTVTKVNKPLPTVNIGDIYVCSWGYEQTNIDYYKITAVKNKTVELVGIGQNRNYTGPMQGECVPDPNVTGTKTYTKRMLVNGDSVSFKMTSYSWAYKWSGKTNHFTEWH